MALTIASLGTPVFTTTAGDKTLTATPTAGDLIVVVAAATGVTGGPIGAVSVSDNNTDGKGSYTKIGASFTGFSTSGGLDMWVRNALVGSGTSTVFTATQTSSTGGGLVVYRIAGSHIVGLGAIRGAGGQSSGGAGATPAPVLLGRVGSTFSGTQAALTGNGMITAVANGSNTGNVTIRSSPAYTRDFDGGYNTPGSGLDAGHLNSGETASTITWGGTSATAFASMAVEVDASFPQYDWVMREPFDTGPGIIQGAVGQGSVW